ncbi:MAG: hypothetical protein P0Y53_20035 [Candidatus Pseudobacter hemicellulosilyticus]|uniref:Uncharacterized protein n=1 Tax=Candidatus Pseudobacter hemicellulosilyticus TaxID=3121375 RepID=A0AAJ5WSB2_9BACT|nr:MAG: hypothetical protein P0Y53_20035 [Pseudobacter sp.]
MMETRMLIARLLIQYRNQQLTGTDQDELLDWVNRSAAHRAVFEKINDRNYLREMLDRLLAAQDRVWKQVWSVLKE